LLGETVHVLLEGVPRGIDLPEVSRVMRGAEGVDDLHDLHVWALTSSEPSLSAHLVIAAGQDADAVRTAVARALADRFGIRHVTLQTERVDCRDCDEPALVH
jgi:cobalt-zinc-cadmium efflux system protein